MRPKWGESKGLGPITVQLITGGGYGDHHWKEKGQSGGDL